MIAEALAEISALGAVTRPYPGLRPFRPEEWSIFCGREQVAREVLYRLAERNLVLVHGGSGSGKSSLVSAGVLPVLRREYAMGDGRLATRVFRPSQGPIQALASVLADALAAPADAKDAAAWWTVRLTVDADLAKTINDRIKEQGLEALCIVVDQFEEIFTWARDRRASDVEVLVRFLSAAVLRPDEGPKSEASSAVPVSRLYVLATMRSDFLGQCAQFPGLADIINRAQYFLPNLDERGLARAIVEPAARFGGRVDPALITRLLGLATATADPLPVMQHALMRMVALEQRTPAAAWVLTLDDLRRVAGRTNALSEHAEQVLADLRTARGASVEEQASSVFRTLLDVDLGGRVTRHARDFASLLQLSGVDAPAADVIIQAYAKEGVNLLVDTGADQGPERRVIDISHEALLRQWSRMSGDAQTPGWVQKEFEDGVAWRALSRNARSATMLSPLSPADRRTFARTARSPERARRYLSQPTGAPDITGEREWRIIEVAYGRTRLGLALTRTTMAALVALLSYLVGERIYAAREVEKRTQSSEVAAVARKDNQIAELEQSLADASGAPADQVVTARELAASPRAITPAKVSGYMWIGDADVTNLRDARGTKVLPGQVHVNERYRVTQNARLRSGLPSSSNVSAPMVGVLKRDDIVMALSVPSYVPPSRQYWLQVRPIVQTRVYIQYNLGDPGAVQALRAQLERSGFRVPPAERLSLAAGVNEIRYCNPADRPEAERLAANLPIAPRLDVKPIGGNTRCSATSGVVELWLSQIEPSA